MRQITFFTATLAALLTLAAPARAGITEDCNQDQNTGRRIIGCTALIRSGESSDAEIVAAYSNREIAYDDRGEYDRAIENYDQALKIDPDHRNSHSNRGVSLGSLGEHQQAIESYDEALRIDPSFVSAYNNRGVAYRNLGENRRAILDYNKALRLDPGYGSAYQNRGVAYESLGEFDRAVEDWERAIQADGASRATWWQNYLKGKGHYAGAIDGIFGPVTRRGLLACAIDPAC